MSWSAATTAVDPCAPWAGDGPNQGQRIALTISQGGCTAEGCDWPPGMCHVHHDQPWSQGGKTDLKDLRLLCPRHHARAHDPTYTMAKLPEGKVRFHRRT